VRGSVQGLSGSGLVLKDNGGDDLTISANGAFAFKSPIPTGSAYAVTVSHQPSTPSQTCSVAQGSGTIGRADVTNVVVSCVTASFTVGGSISGLVGAGLVLRDNGGDDLPVNASGAFVFSTKVNSGAPYAVSIAHQPAGQTCNLAAASGTVGSGNVTSVLVNCATDTYAIGGTISGLAGGSVKLQNAGGDDLLVNANGPIAFATPLPTGAPYDVAVVDQPTNPNQTCVVTNGAGNVAAANVSDVQVVCSTTTYAIAVHVSGLAGAGLSLQNEGGDDLSIAADGDYAFAIPVADGQPYDVLVVAQPMNPNQTCTVQNGASNIAGADANVQVSCVTNAYAITVDVQGLLGDGLVLQNEAGDDLPVQADGKYTFATNIVDGQPYDVTVSAQPLDQVCTVQSGTGSVAGGDVTNIVVLCN
jgi:hypothetical protein